MSDCNSSAKNNNFRQNLLEFTEAIVVLMILLSVKFLLISPEIESPSHSFIGDEWSFFENARDIYKNDFVANPFSAGVYDGNSKMASMIQAIPFLFIEDASRAWRISTAIMQPLLAFMMFLWLRCLVDRNTGLVAAALVISSHYLIGFSTISYPNLQGTVWLALVTWLITACHVQKRSIIFHIAVGAASGLSLFFYYGASFPILIAGYCLCLMSDKKSCLTFKCIALWVMVAIFVAIPGFCDYQFISNVLVRTAPDRPLTIAERTLNSWRMLSAHWQNQVSGHFVSGPIIDSFSGIFLAVGIGLGLIRRPASTFLTLLVYWASCSIAIGALNGYYYGLAVTRSHFVLVPSFALTAATIIYITQIIRVPMFRVAVTSLTVLVIFIFNFNQLTSSEKDYRLTSPACILKIASENTSGIANVLSWGALSRVRPTDVDTIRFLIEQYQLKDLPVDSNPHLDRIILNEIRRGCI